MSDCIDSEFEPGDVILMLSSGSGLEKAISIGQAASSRSRKNYRTIHAGIISGEGTLSEVTGQGVYSAGIIINNNGELEYNYYSQDGERHNVVIEKGNWLVYRLNIPESVSNCDEQVISELAQFIRNGNGVADLKKRIEKRIEDKTKALSGHVSGQILTTAQKTLRDFQMLADLDDGALLQFMRGALQRDTAGLAGDLAAGISGQEGFYDSDLKGDVKYNVVGAATSVLLSRFRSGKVTRGQRNRLTNLVNSVGQLRFDKKLYCSNFVVYTYALASIIHSSSPEETEQSAPRFSLFSCCSKQSTSAVAQAPSDLFDYQEFVINLNVNRVSPSELHEYFNSTDLWNNVTEAYLPREENLARDQPEEAKSEKDYEQNSQSGDGTLSQGRGMFEASEETMHNDSTSSSAQPK